MNELITTDQGGFPVVLDDLRFSHGGTQDAIVGMLIGLAQGATTFIVSGVEITGGGSPQDVSAGWVMIDSELIKVDAHTVINIEQGDYRHIVVADTFDPEGSKAFEDGPTFDTYRMRRATIQVGNNPVGVSETVFTSALFPTLSSLIIGDQLNEFGEFWTSASAIGNITVSPNATVSGGTTKHKQIGRLGFLNMRVNYALSGSEITLEVSLPAGFTIASSEVGTVVGMATVSDSDGISMVQLIAQSPTLLFCDKLGAAFASGNGWIDIDITVEVVPV